MRVSVRKAEKAAHAAAAMAETAATIKSMQAITAMVHDLNAGGPLSEYGTGYRRALIDVFIMLDPDKSYPEIPQQVWEQ